MSIEETKTIIDQRIDKCFEHQSKVDSEDFVFDVYVNTTLLMANEIDYTSGLCGCLLALAARAIAFGNYNKAKEYLEKVDASYDIEALSLKVQLRYYSAYFVMAAECENNFDQILMYAKKQMSVAEALGDHSELMRIKMNIGALSIDFNYLDTAMQFLSEAKTYYDSVDNKVLLACCYLNLGEVYTDQNNRTMAETMFMQAMELADQENEYALLFNASIGLAVIRKDQGRYDEAVTLLGESLVRADAMNHLNYKVDVIFELISIYKLTNRYEEALQALTNIEHAVISFDDKMKIMQFYEEKASVLEHLGHFKEAFAVLKHVASISDQITEQNNNETMNQLIELEYQNSLARLEALAQIGREITLQNDVDSVILRAREQLKKIMDVDAIGIGLIKENVLDYGYFFLEGHKLREQLMPLERQESLGAYCISHQTEVVINDLPHEYQDYIKHSRLLEIQSKANQEPIRSVMCAPLYFGEKIIGVFTIQSFKQKAYSSADIKVFRILTDYIAIGVKNSIAL